MTFDEAFNSGCRFSFDKQVKHTTWWKKHSETEITVLVEGKRERHYQISKCWDVRGTNTWYLNPDDERVLNYNSKLMNLIMED